MKKLLVLCFGLLLVGMLVGSIVNGERQPKPGDDKVRVSGKGVKTECNIWEKCPGPEKCDGDQDTNWVKADKMPCSINKIEIDGGSLTDDKNVQLEDEYLIRFSGDNGLVAYAIHASNGETLWWNKGHITSMPNDQLRCVKLKMGNTPSQSDHHVDITLEPKYKTVFSISKCK